MTEIPETKLTTDHESISLIFSALETVCSNNIKYFCSDKSTNGIALHEAFVKLLNIATQLEPVVKEINDIVIQYDYDVKTPANGFRSFVIVVIASIKFSIQMCNKICVKRDGLLFRKGNIIREVESCVELLSTLCTLMTHVKTLSVWCPPGDLFVPTEHSPEELLSKAEEINQLCFYGRCLGFQFCESMRSILKFLSLSMAVYSEAYYNTGSFLSKATTSMWTSSKYLLDADIRARRIVNISQNSKIDFCKSYWLLAEMEIMLRLPSLISASVAISHVVNIPPEPLVLDQVDIPIPTAHLGSKSIPIRLISHSARQGMMGGAIGRRPSALLPPSKYLLIHCHGGGFVAQSSRSHEIYLRDWAQQLSVPIVSVDYSLAPEAPFPRAVQEVFYAYCWAVKNSHLLGSTGEIIIMVGDSAGGNLCLSAALKCIEMNVRRPDGLFLAYVPVSVEFILSPSRLLCIMDPLLPFGFMMRCLKCYASVDAPAAETTTPSSSTESFEEVSESDLMELQAHKSPTSDTSDTLTNVSLSSQPLSCSSNPNVLEKYILDSDTDSDGNKVKLIRSNAKIANDTPSLESKNTTLDFTLQQKFSGFVGALTNKITTKWKNRKRLTAAEQFLDSDRQKSLAEEFKFSVPRNPFLSPYWASNDVLRQLPPTRILTVELDPCLDDCVMFAKKLKGLENNVDIDVLPGLPHGFLNFSAISKDAHNGSKVCIERIKELIKLNDTQPE